MVPVLKRSYMWSACGLALLVTCASVISVYVAMQRMLSNEEKRGAVDFIMTGPDKFIPGHVEVSRNRAEMYSMAIFRDKNNKSSDVFATVQVTEKETETENNIIENNPLKLVCYYSLPVNGSTEEQLLPEFIDPLLCTHIIVAFAFIANGTLQPGSISDFEVYKQVVDMKKQNPSLKIMLSIQCFSNNGEFAYVVETKISRERFIKSVLKTLNDFSFDGIDIDWEFPVWPGSDKRQLTDFMKFLKELKTALKSGNNEFLISVAVAAPGTIIDKAYDIKEMAEYVDFVNLMSYDYHYYASYLPVTGPNAPLYPRHSEHGFFTTLNTNWSASYWLSKGMPLNKIIIGLPTYGHSYTLLNEENTGWDAPATGLGQMGEDGFVQFPDICQFLKREGTKVVFDDEHKVPYTYNGKEWISYDDEQSLGIKAQFVKTKGYGGVMVYALNDDDFKASCASTYFPLIRNVRYILDDDQL
ncbi:chitinase-3-like protein 2 isoform X2 [Lycorma delicatula]|uniref:chitinase-3-like protein 2 isoform X2 n=1 Tax=Lycorma delicatula TaxID=130591 RepID=UPI003F50DFF8